MCLGGLLRGSQLRLRSLWLRCGELLNRTQASTRTQHSRASPHTAPKHLPIYPGALWRVALGCCGHLGPAGRPPPRGAGFSMGLLALAWAHRGSSSQAPKALNADFTRPMGRQSAWVSAGIRTCLTCDWTSSVSDADALSGYPRQALPRKR